MTQITSQEESGRSSWLCNLCHLCNLWIISSLSPHLWSFTLPARRGHSLHLDDPDVVVDDGVAVVLVLERPGIRVLLLAGGALILVLHVVVHVHAVVLERG